VMMMNDGDDSVCFRVWGCRKQLCWDLCTVHKDFLTHHNHSHVYNSNLMAAGHMSHFCNRSGPLE